MVLGGVLYFTSPARASTPDRSAAGTDMVNGLTGGADVGDGQTEGGEDAGSLRTFSPAIFRLGFSFVAGFALAYAARTFLRISLLAMGVFLLALFGLEYAEVITVNWDTMREHYDTFASSIGSSFSDFRTFITGRLPSSAAGVAGLVLGFRKH